MLAFVNSTSRLCVAWYYDPGLTAEACARGMLALLMQLIETEGIMDRTVESIVL